MLSALDPPGFPFVTQVLAGKATDGPLSVPAITRVSQRVPEHGVLDLGTAR
jgi:hypothetical protein